MKTAFIPFSVLLGIILMTSCSVQEKIYTYTSDDKPSTISVSGIGTVFVQPDMAQLTISISHTDSTTMLAKHVVDRNVQQLKKILKQEGIKDNDMQTLSLNYREEYVYNEGKRTKIGQRAEQNILISVDSLNSKPEKLSQILDRVVKINQAEVQSIQFDIKNKENPYKESRKLAFQKALDKATQYALLSNRKLGKVLTISENSSQDVAQKRFFKSSMSSLDMALVGSEASFIPTGEQGITTEIYVSFLIE